MNDDDFFDIGFPPYHRIAPVNDATGRVEIEVTTEKKEDNKKISEFLSKLSKKELDEIGQMAREEKRNRPCNGIKRGDKFTIEIEVLETSNSTIFLPLDKDYLVKVGSNRVELSYAELVELTTKLGKLL